MQRLPVDVYFTILAKTASLRSTCSRRRVGAVVVSHDRLVSTGYNGSPSGLAHCDDVGCMMEDGRCKRTIHAELNAVLRAPTGDTIYTTDQPCFECTKAIIAAGIRRIVFCELYQDDKRDALIAELSCGSGPRFGLVVQRLIAPTNMDIAAFFDGKGEG
jgi:dCMP deaminase